jgi:hypothetical protein
VIQDVIAKIAYDLRSWTDGEATYELGQAAILATLEALAKMERDADYTPSVQEWLDDLRAEIESAA